jgi:hypothetical protein
MLAGHKFVVATVILASAFVGTVQANPLSKLASDNATVKPGGPRTGTSGKNFFNVEGSANATNASYGVADFNFGALGQTVVTVNSAQLVLTESNAAFTTPGTVVISLDQSAALADIQPGTSPLKFDGSDPGTATDVTLANLSLLSFSGGPFAFTTAGNVNNGLQDTYSLGLSGAIQAEMTNRLNSGTTIRIVLGSGSTTVAATWAGFSNATFAGPTLNLDVTYALVTPTSSTTWGRMKKLYR